MTKSQTKVTNGAILGDFSKSNHNFLEADHDIFFEYTHSDKVSTNIKFDVVGVEQGFFGLVFLNNQTGKFLYLLKSLRIQYNSAGQAGFH